MAPRPYQQHGLNHLKRRLKVRGLGGIDRRSKAARALSAWRTELEADLGGPRAISAQERHLGRGHIHPVAGGQPGQMATRA